MRKNLLWIPLMTTIIFSLFSMNMIGITVAQADHDIAVVSVTPSLTSVRLGEFVNITVVVKNNGTAAETFNATVHYDTTAIETKTVQNLTAGLTKSLTFTWNTTDVKEEIYATDEKEKTYIINATAPLALDENPVDNTFVLEDAVTVRSQYIAVIPQSTVDLTLTPGKNYTVSIYTDYNGSDVWSWQFGLSYNPLVLNGVKVTNGDLITTDKHPDIVFKAGTFNNTIGKLSNTIAWFYYKPGEPVPTTSGPGILANLTFTVVGNGTSDLTLVGGGVEDSILIGYTPHIFYDIVNSYLPHFDHILHGHFQNVPDVVHDIAVVSVTPSPTSVLKGEFVNITVVVENQGTVAETFDVEVNYVHPKIAGYTLIETQTLQNLAADADTTLTSAWNTTLVPAGDITIVGVAKPVSGETDTDDNTLESDEIVTVAEPEETPLPVTELTIGVVVVVVVIAVVIYALKRRKKPIPE